MTHGRQIVTTIGTAVQVSTDTTVWSRIDCQALYSNSGYVCIGGPGVRARSGECNAILLKGGTSLERQVFTNTALSSLWIDADTANDGIAFVCHP